MRRTRITHARRIALYHTQCVSGGLAEALHQYTAWHETERLQIGDRLLRSPADVGSFGGTLHRWCCSTGKRGRLGTSQTPIVSYVASRKSWPSMPLGCLSGWWSHVSHSIYCVAFAGIACSTRICIVHTSIQACHIKLPCAHALSHPSAASRRVSVINEPSNKLRDVAALLRTTLLLISPHGAHFANVPFMQAGAGVVELMPPDYDSTMYKHLCEHSRLVYERVLAPPSYAGRNSIGRSIFRPAKYLFAPVASSSPFKRPFAASESDVLEAVLRMIKRVPDPFSEAQSKKDLQLPPRESAAHWKKPHLATSSSVAV